MKKQTCPKCGGKGFNWQSPTEKIDCPNCHNTGKVDQPDKPQTPGSCLKCGAMSHITANHTPAEPASEPDHDPIPPKGCNCASFWTIRGTHKKDCPLATPIPSGEAKANYPEIEGIRAPAQPLPSEPTMDFKGWTWDSEKRDWVAPSSPSEATELEDILAELYWARHNGQEYTEAMQRAYQAIAHHSQQREAEARDKQCQSIAENLDFLLGGDNALEAIKDYASQLKKRTKQ